MSAPNAIPISSGLSQGDLANSGEEVLRAIMNTTDPRARQVIGSIPRRYVFSAPYRILNPGLPQFNVSGAAAAAAFR